MINPHDLFDIANAASILRTDPGQVRLRAMHGQHFPLGNVLDSLELVFGGDIADRDDLHQLLSIGPPM